MSTVGFVSPIHNYTDTSHVRCSVTRATFFEQ